MIHVSPDEEIASIRLLCSKQWEMSEEATFTTSARHYGSVVALIEQGMEDPNRETRLKVIEKFTGRSIQSSSKLTSWECHVLIEQLKDPYEEKWSISEHGAKLVTYAEKEVNAFEAAGISGPEPEQGSLEGAFRGGNRPGECYVPGAPAVKAGPVAAKNNKPGAWPDVSDLW